MNESAKNVDRLPSGGFVRESDLLGRNGGPLPFSAATLWRMVKTGRFPKPEKLSAGVTAWQVGAVRQWLADRASLAQ